MRWSDREESSNIEDIRGASGGRRYGSIGVGGIIIVLIIAFITKQNPLSLLSQVSDSGTSAQTQRAPSQHEEDLKKFTAVTLRDTEVVWSQVFKELGRDYIEPKLVMFTDQVESGCGLADAGMGPFYCGNDEKVYIDLSFYDLMKQRFGARGDFAQAYVIAHEVGHHVQKQLGTLDKVHALQGRMSAKQYNQESVKLELQADFYAGYWARRAEQMAGINENDIEDALNAANAIGDDTLQKQAQGHVVPDAFTHGTSSQRMRWFMKGWQARNISEGNTFDSPNL